MKNIRLWKIYLWGLILTLWMASCQEEKGTTEPIPEFAIQEVHIPALISKNSRQTLLFTARVTHPEGEAGIASVSLVLAHPDSGEQLIPLYDDGGAEHTSMDVVAHDQVYTQGVIPVEWNFTQGNYQAWVRAIDRHGKVLESENQSLEVVDNTAPRIVHFLMPDSILTGMVPTPLTVTIQDSDGVDDVRWVILKGIPTGLESISFTDTLFPPGNHSPVFQKTVDSSYAVGKKGDYRLECFAEDRVGDTSAVVVRSLYVENTPPRVFQLNMPDSMHLPPQGYYNRAILTIHVQDGQSLDDVQMVYFDSYLPGGVPSSGNPFQMYDNGLPYDPNNPVAVGDSVAGDGIYTLSIFLPPTASIGTYQFYFYAKDRVGQISSALRDSIVVLPQGEAGKQGEGIPPEMVQPDNQLR